MRDCIGCRVLENHNACHKASKRIKTLAKYDDDFSPPPHKSEMSDFRKMVATVQFPERDLSPILAQYCNSRQGQQRYDPARMGYDATRPIHPAPTMELVNLNFTQPDPVSFELRSSLESNEPSCNKDAPSRSGGWFVESPIMSTVMKQMDQKSTFPDKW